VTIPNGWMGKEDHRGWRGVTDPLHILIAVCFEPISGSLVCHFNSGPDLIHVGVPEAAYRAITSSPYGGAYYRKQVRNKYPCPYADNPPPYKPESSPPDKHLRVQEIPDGTPDAQMSLFLQAAPGNRRKKREKRLIGG